MRKLLRYLILILSILLNDSLFAMEELSVKQKCVNLELLDLSNEVLLNIIEQSIKTYINNWQDVCKFSQEVDIKSVQQEIFKWSLLNHRFKELADPCFEILRLERFKYLIDKLEKENALTFEQLYLELKELLEESDINIENFHKIVKLILIGGNPNVSPRSRMVPLIEACLCSDFEIVNWLIQAGADVNAQDFCAMTPLLSALVTKTPNIDIIKLLIDKGADINFQWPSISSSGLTALMAAARAGYKDVMILLINLGADINIQDANGSSALDYALRSNNFEIFRILLCHKIKSTLNRYDMAYLIGQFKRKII